VIDVIVVPNRPIHGEGHQHQQGADEPLPAGPTRRVGCARFSARPLRGFAGRHRLLLALHATFYIVPYSFPTFPGW
jgi:hypothetical protein